MFGPTTLLGGAMALLIADDTRPLVTLTVAAQQGAEANTIDISLNGSDAPDVPLSFHPAATRVLGLVICSPKTGSRDVRVFR